MAQKVTDPDILAQLNSAASPAGPGTGTLPSPPAAPITPAQQAQIDISQGNLDINERKERREEAKAEEEARQAKRMRENSYAGARAKMTRLVGQISKVALDADDNSGLFETGATGKFSRDWLPAGTAGYDLGENVKTLDANFAFDALQAMRDASKTGGALGQVSNIELELLKASVANLNVNQGHETFMANLEMARQVYLDKLALFDPEGAKQMGYNPEKARAAWEKLARDYEAKFGTDAGGIEAPVKRDVRSFATEGDKARAVELNEAFRNGAGARELVQIMRRHAADVDGSVSAQDARDIRDAVKFREQNGPYDAFYAAESGQQTATEDDEALINKYLD